MTLDEAIKRYTDNAEYERTHGSLQGCLDFKQLAEWLTDYKRLLAQETKTGEWQQDLDGTYLCSECGSGFKEQPTLMGKPMFLWCPLCGAKMSEIPTDWR